MKSDFSHLVRSEYLSPWRMALFLAALGFLLYGLSLKAPFIYDDDPSIVSNPNLRSWNPVWKPFLAPSGWDISTDGRPFLSASLAANYSISGLDTWSYHLVNTSIHVLFAWVLGVFITEVLKNHGSVKLRLRASVIGWTSSILWLVHPLHTSAVIYVAQRAECLTGLLYLLTLYFFYRGELPGKGKANFRRLSLLTCILGMVTKEHMVTAPLAVLIYDWVVLKSSPKQIVERKFYYCCLFSSWMILASFVLTSARWTAFQHEGTYDRWQYLLMQCEIIPHYLRLAVFPYPLIFDYSWSVPSVGQAWPGGMFLITAFSASVVLAIKRNLAGFCGVMFFIFLAPTSSFQPHQIVPAAEYRMYLPLAILIPLFIGLIMFYLNADKYAGTLIFMFFAIFLAGSVLTIARGIDYRDEVLLWSDTLAKQPDSARAMSNYALALYKRNANYDASVLWERSLKIEPSNYLALYNLATYYGRSGNTQRAISLFEKALEINDHDADLLNNYGNTLKESGKADEAIVAYYKAFELNHLHPMAAYNIAVFKFENRDWKGAREYAEAARLADPKNDYARRLLKAIDKQF